MRCLLYFTDYFLDKVITLLGVAALSVGLAQQRSQRRRGEEGRHQNPQRGAGQAGQVDPEPLWQHFQFKWISIQFPFDFHLISI